MGTYYRKLQTVKHALQYYITRPNANEKDLAREKNLLKQVEEEVEIFQERNHIPKKEVEAAEKTINNLYGLLREYCQQKEKLLKQNTKLLAIYTVVIIAHVITTIIDQSYRNTLMFYFLTIVSLVYGIGCVVKSHKRKGGWNEYID